jgi:hypothetical protein
VSPDAGWLQCKYCDLLCCYVCCRLTAAVSIVRRFIRGISQIVKYWCFDGCADCFSDSEISARVTCSGGFADGLSEVCLTSGWTIVPGVQHCVTGLLRGRADGCFEAVWTVALRLRRGFSDSSDDCLDGVFEVLRGCTDVFSGGCP